MDINYIESIKFKLKTAKYHSVRCIGNANYPNKFESKEKQNIAVSAEFTAMMLSLQSSLDLLSQLINQNKHLGIREHEVSFKKILKKRDKPELVEIKDSLDKLELKSKYLIDYCNTSKHRNLIEISSKHFFLSPSQPIKYFIVSSFKKDSREYDSQSLSYITRNTYELISTLVNDISSRV